MSEDKVSKSSRKKRDRRRLNLDQSKSTVFIPTEGTVLNNRYRLVHEIGRGGMGVVYEAMDEELEQSVAIKLLPPELAGSKRAVKSLKREAVLAMKLRHPGIMALYNFEDSEKAKYLVMELLKGETLDDKLADEDAISTDELIKINEALAQALDYAHGENIIHRDIKPNNIFLNQKGEKTVPTIMDFGIARQIKDSMSKLTNQDSAGTLHYMSPEQLQGKEVDNRSDIYSLAATIYECASGNPPFHSGAISYQITTAKAEPIEDIPQSFNDALLKALEKNPDDRFSSAMEFASALKGEVNAPPPVPSAPPPEEYNDEELDWLDKMGEVKKDQGDDKDEFAGYEALVMPTSKSKPEKTKVIEKQPEETKINNDKQKETKSDIKETSPVREIQSQSKNATQEQAQTKGCLGRGFSCLGSSLKIILFAAVVICLFLLAVDYLIEDEPPVNLKNNGQQTNTNTSRTQYTFPDTGNNKQQPINVKGHQAGAMDPHNYSVTDNNNNLGQSNRFNFDGPMKGTGILGHTPTNNAPVFTTSPEDRARELVTVAEDALLSGNSTTALESIERLKEEVPAHIEEGLPVICQMLDMNKLDDAVSGLLLMPKAYSDPGLWMRTGIKAYEQGKTIIASKAFSKVLEGDPDSAEAYYYRAKLCMDKNDRAKAQVLMRKAVNLEHLNRQYRDFAQEIGALPSRKETIRLQNLRNNRLISQTDHMRMETSTGKRPRAAINLILNISKVPAVHVTNVSVTLTAMDGSITAQGLDNIEGTLQQRNKTQRIYVIRKVIPSGRYNVEVSIDAAIRVLGMTNTLIPGYHPLGEIMVKRASGFTGTYNLIAPEPPQSNYGGY